MVLLIGYISTFFLVEKLYRINRQKKRKIFEVIIFSKKIFSYFVVSSSNNNNRSDLKLSPKYAYISIINRQFDITIIDD